MCSEDIFTMRSLFTTHQTQNAHCQSSSPKFHTIREVLNYTIETQIPLEILVCVVWCTGIIEWDLSFVCLLTRYIIWLNQKCTLLWKISFYFIFVFAICSSKMKTHHVTRDLFTEKVLSRLDNFNSRDPFTYYDWTLAPCGFLRSSVFLSDTLNYFLSISSHSMWKDRASWKLSQRERSI